MESRAEVRATSNLTATDVRRGCQHSTARPLFAPQGGICVVCRGNADFLATAAEDLAAMGSAVGAANAGSCQLHHVVAGSGRR